MFWNVCAIVQTWCSILAAVPGSRLVLKSKPFLCLETQRYWLRRFTARGIPGWRISLFPLTTDTCRHLSQYAMMDISLDPWPYSGVSSTYCQHTSIFVCLSTLKPPMKPVAHKGCFSQWLCFDLSSPIKTISYFSCVSYACHVHLKDLLLS
jgi:hypothetical protein